MIDTGPCRLHDENCCETKHTASLHRLKQTKTLHCSVHLIMPKVWQTEQTCWYVHTLKAFIVVGLYKRILTLLYWQLIVVPVSPLIAAVVLCILPEKMKSWCPAKQSKRKRSFMKVTLGHLLEYEILVSEEQRRGGRSGLAQSQTSDLVLQLQRNNWSSLDSQPFSFQFPKRLLQTWQYTLQWSTHEQKIQIMKVTIRIICYYLLNSFMIYCQYESGHFGLSV